MDIQKISAGLFKHYPSVNEFYITEDGQAFEMPHNALAHATQLDKKNPKVTTVSRDKAETEAKKQAYAEALAKDAEAKKQAEEAAAKAKAKKEANANAEAKKKAPKPKA